MKGSGMAINQLRTVYLQLLYAEKCEGVDVGSVLIESVDTIGSITEI